MTDFREVSTYKLKQKREQLSRYIDQAKETAPEGRARGEMFTDLKYKEQELHQIRTELQTRKLVDE